MIAISVIIVTRNEERYIIDCIQSIENQFDPNHQWELIIVDGQSEDNTVKLSKNYLETSANYPFQIIDNPKRILASGWNIGIKASKGEFIIRPDAHAILYPDYISVGLKTLAAKPEVGAVGGTLKTLSKNFWGNLIKVALSSKIGVGNSSFRVGAKSGYKDTAVYGIYRKQVFDDAGLFDEALTRHQDTEFHARVVSKGWKFWLNDKMKAGYYCRDSLFSLAKQMFNIGLYIPDLVVGKKTQGVQIRHMMPFIFFSVFFAGFIIGFFVPIFQWLAVLQMAIYLLVLLLFSVFRIFSSGKFEIKYLLLAPVIFTMHFCYFAGTLMGFMKKLFRRKT
ncbi:MAG: glycosyltransferase family 2 protein [Bacteroidales bacterium]